MPYKTEVKWDVIKAAYLAGLPLIVLSEKFGISKGTVTSYASRHGWNAVSESSIAEGVVKHNTKKVESNAVVMQSKDESVQSKDESVQFQPKSAVSNAVLPQNERSLVELLTENRQKAQEKHVNRMARIMEKHGNKADIEQVSSDLSERKTQVEIIEKVDKITRRTLGMPSGDDAVQNCINIGIVSGLIDSDELPDIVDVP